MVNLSTVTTSNKALTSQPLVAVFVAGSSGIGSYALLALCSAFASHGSGGAGLRAYVVGRNKDVALALLEECERMCPRAVFRFVQVGDLALLSEADVAVREIEKWEKEAEARGVGKARIDLLFMTASPVLFQPRTETHEGLDIFTSLLLYSRLRFIHSALPLLLSSTLPSAHIISIYAATVQDSLDTTDLTLRKPGNYTFTRSRGHVVYMKTLMFEQLAKRYSGKLSLVHAFPGLVITPSFSKEELPWWWRCGVGWFVRNVVGGIIALKPEESGARTLFMGTARYAGRGVEVSKEDDGGQAVVGTDGFENSGAYGLNWDGEVAKRIDWKSKGVVDKDVFGMEVWQHVMSVCKSVDKGEKFAG